MKGNYLIYLPYQFCFKDQSLDWEPQLLNKKMEYVKKSNTDFNFFPNERLSLIDKQQGDLFQHFSHNFGGVWIHPQESVRLSVRPSICPSVGPSVRPSVPLICWSIANDWGEKWGNERLRQFFCMFECVWQVGVWMGVDTSAHPSATI